MPFFPLNLIHDYNIGMNATDLADQIRNTYRWDLFMQKRKWWWSIMMWCLQMLLDNLYIFTRSTWRCMIWRQFHISILTRIYVWLGLILITTVQRRNAHIKLGIVHFNPLFVLHRNLLTSWKGRPDLLTSLCILSLEVCLNIYKNQNHTGQFQLQSWLQAVSYIFGRLVERRRNAHL